MKSRIRLWIYDRKHPLLALVVDHPLPLKSTLFHLSARLFFVPIVFDRIDMNVHSNWKVPVLTIDLQPSTDVDKLSQDYFQIFEVYLECSRKTV